MVEIDKQSAFAQKLAGYSPIAWEQIPDLGLYMDQVVTFIDRQCKGLYAEGERIFTPAMVNNYVKLGLVDRPKGKKYAREALAQLLMICVLKQAASAEGMKRLVKPRDGETLETVYRHFCALQTETFTSLSRELPLPSPMTCAVRNAAYRFLCNAILNKDQPSAPAAKAEGET